MAGGEIKVPSPNPFHRCYSRGIKECRPLRRVVLERKKTEKVRKIMGILRVSIVRDILMKNHWIIARPIS